MSEFRRRLMMARKGAEPLILPSYTIDQRVHTTSTSMISVNSQMESMLQRIHDASHCYVCELVNGTLQCKQLSDTNKAIYADGTTPSLTSSQDVMMKLPKFWWKCTPSSSSDDVAEINITMDEPDDSASWHVWDGNTFIGCYKGLASESKLHSRSGLVAGGYARTTLNNYRTYARNKGAGYSCITYEVIQILAILGFGRLKALTPRAAGYNFGVNRSDSYTTGNCDSLGMQDGKFGNYSNFWGIEDYITGVGFGEYIDNINRDGNGFYILDTSNLSTVLRSISCVSTFSGNNFTKKILLGINGDIFPKEVTTTRPNDTTGYGGYINISNVGFFFPNMNNTTNTSFVCLQATTLASASVNYVTSRLQYKGNYIII